MRATLLAVGALSQGCGAFDVLAPAALPRHRLVSRSAPMTMLEPVTASALAGFVAGLVPPSALLAAKERELIEVREEVDLARSELSRIRAGFNEVIAVMELDVDVVDAQLEELVSASTEQARKKREDIVALKEKYEGQIKDLKSVLGEYTDRLELQQNTFTRLQSIADSARSESLALKERAQLLERRLLEASAQLEVLQQKVDSNPFGFLNKLFGGQ
mmetsp:Transcript_11349/g.19397  ORF Transcript_11349/g.19397 Transcript_11349/m.19397 type:complete len:217 (-) Transcript_11349:105-755(-)